jgi:hypothetical protein
MSIGPSQLDGLPSHLRGPVYRTPQGLLSVIRTERQVTPSPDIMQLWWTHLSRGRYSPLDAATPKPARACEWRGPFTVICDRCRRSVGECVAYSVHGALGIVEDTAKQYAVEGALPESMQLRARRYLKRGPRPRYRLTGDNNKARGERRTMVHFRCLTCQREYVRNMYRFGCMQFEAPSDHVLFEGAY